MGPRLRHRDREFYLRRGHVSLLVFCLPNLGRGLFALTKDWREHQQARERDQRKSLQRGMHSDLLRLQRFFEILLRIPLFPQIDLGLVLKFNLPLSPMAHTP